jgi:phage antirepressor YoqD-like protein
MPRRENEAARDPLRCRGDLKDDLKRTKQRLLKFLLRHGYTYDRGRYWTVRHIQWMLTAIQEAAGSDPYGEAEMVMILIIMEQ